MLQKSLTTTRKRSGAPAVFTPEQVMQIIELACRDPCDFGYEVSQWSLNLLVMEIKKQGIVEQISARSVSRFLKMRQTCTPTKSATGSIPQKRRKIRKPLPGR